MPADPAKLLKHYEEQGFNILTPSITLDGLSERHKATVETIRLSPNPEIGDVYKHQEGKFIISKQGLDKLAVLADIIWDKDECKLIGDPKDRRNYVAFQAFGAIKKADGKYVPAKGYKDMDFVVEREELEFKYKQKARKANKTGEAAREYIEYCVERDMIHKRKYGAEMCESGARNRVTRALLGVLKGYTQKQLEKPFVVVKITYQPDYEDPEIKKLMTYLSATAQTNIFGPLPNAPMLPGPLSKPKAHKEEYATEDAIIVESDDVPDAENGDVVPDEDAPDDLEDGEVEFGLWDRKSQEAEINRLAKQKGYALQGLLDRMKEKKNIAEAKLSAVDDIPLIQIYDKIKSMIDKPAEDDIPF